MSGVYLTAARLLAQFLANSGNIKSLVFNANDAPTGIGNKQVYLLVTETLRYKSILDEIIAKCKLVTNKTKVSRELVTVQLYDYLFGAKTITGGGAVKKWILTNKTLLQSTLARLYIQRGVSTAIELLPEGLRPLKPVPRYVRLNLAIVSGDVEAKKTEIVREIEALGFTFTGTHSLSANDNDSKTNFHYDELVPNVLVFHPSAASALLASSLYQRGILVLQDKASCIPALALDPSTNDWVVDGCSAPGNKTSHLLAIMTEKAARQGVAVSGGVDAYEVHEHRYALLAKMMTLKHIDFHTDATSGGKQSPPLTLHRASFLSVSPSSVVGRRATAALLDPTCSGTGMRHTIEQHYKQQRHSASTHTNIHNHSSKKRMRDDSHDSANDATEDVAENDSGNQSVLSLAQFQLSLLAHALAFPALRTLVYSTCSIHTEENELVVKQFLDEKGARAKGWRVATRAEMLPAWHRRGASVDGLSESEVGGMIRCDSKEDSMNGFFVCKFVRDSSATGAASAPAADVTTDTASTADSPSTTTHSASSTSATVSTQSASKKRKKKKRRKATDSAASANANDASNNSATGS